MTLLTLVDKEGSHTLDPCWMQAPVGSRIEHANSVTFKSRAIQTEPGSGHRCGFYVLWLQHPRGSLPSWPQHLDHGCLPWLSLTQSLWEHNVGSPEWKPSSDCFELQVQIINPFPEWCPTNLSFQERWQALGLESFISCCSSQQPLLHSTTVFLSEALWSPPFSLCLCRFSLLFSWTRDWKPGRKCRLTFPFPHCVLYFQFLCRF